MSGYLSLILHAHLPFVRHPEHERFLEENWLFEAITETYVPLLQLLERWRRDGLQPRLTLTLTPTLCSMLRDPLLQDRYERHLNELIELAEKEIHRTRWEKPFHELALFYHGRFAAVARRLRRLRARPGGRLPAVPGAGASGNHHQRRHARAAAAAGRSSALPARADPGRARPLPELLWPRAAGHLAAGMRLCREPGGGPAGGQPPLVRHRHARHAARPAAAALRDLCPDLHAERHRRLWPRPRFRPRRSGAGTPATRATRATATSTATSASTSTWIT